MLVLSEGHIAYHGAADTLLHYFGVEQPDELFLRLTMRPPDEWHRAWGKYRAAYYATAQLDAVAERVIRAGGGTPSFKNYRPA